MPKQGDLKVIDGVEHEYTADGKWAPSAMDSAKDSVVKAGMGLFKMIKGDPNAGSAQAAAPAPVPYQNTIGGKIGYPK